MSNPNQNSFRARKQLIAPSLSAIGVIIAGIVAANSVTAAEPSSILAKQELATSLAPALASPITDPAAPSAPSTAGDPATVSLRQTLTRLYPHTRFGDIQRSAIPGIWEVWMGNNVAYVNDEGRHFIFGHLYDMQTQTDLTAAKKEQASVQAESARPRIKFADLPLGDAIKAVRGNGQRKMAVFSDPHCPYCRQLELELAKLDNVTIYTFLYPIESLHPQAASVAQSIWCAKDKSAAWRQYMTTGKKPKVIRCDTPINRNVALANSAGIFGTPYLLFANGTQAPGAMPAAALEQRLSSN
ncbi:DsbC family protein [Janthinobacterium sp. J1-1]|uniref:DsbC family protein n=1 Tax=Janthinobacterium sp. J1-1 TaxID=3065910 RepID=UPI002810BA67|nr:DsbC family protein [Janthinobacterium sp. J1-1]